MLYEGHSLRGEWHRTDGPAVVTYRRGVVQSESFYRFGELGGGPQGETTIFYYPNGAVSSRVYSDDLAGPKSIGFHPTGERNPDEDTWAVGSNGFRPAGVPRAVAKLSRSAAVDWVTRKNYFDEFEDHGLTAEQIVDALRSGVRSREGLLEVANGSPVEWVVAFESGRSQQALEGGWKERQSG